MNYNIKEVKIIPETHNFIILKLIEINNYKTYLNLKIPFKDSVATLVGPNECGKTNLLESIDYLKNYPNLKKNDTCLYCEDVWNKEPFFIYHLNPSVLDLNKNIKEIRIKVKSNEVEILEPDDLKSNVIIKDKLKISFPVGGGGHVHVKFPPEIRNKYKLPETITVKDGEEQHIPILNDSELKLFNDFNSSTNLFNNVKIEKTRIPEKEASKTEEVLQKILDKIKIIYWKFDETKFIQDNLDMNSLTKNPEKYQYILNMFKIAGIDLTVFLAAADIQRINMLTRINRKISNLIKKNWKDQNLDFFLTMGKNNSLITSFQENDQNIEPGKRSEGFKWFLSFLLDFNAQFGSEIKNCLILLDEPGIHLHPGGQRILLKQIEVLSKDNQIVYTTHLPFMINRMFPKRILYLNKKVGITELIKPRKEGVFDDILLSSTLGYNFTSLSRWGDIIVFVEGITDEILLKKIILVKAEKDKEIILNLNEFSINPINGVRNLESFIRVAKVTMAKYLVFLDNDEEVKKCTKKYKKRPKAHPETIDHIIFLDDNKTIEDYIPLEILNNALTNLTSSKDIYYAKYMNSCSFTKESIKPQLKNLITKINEQIEANKQDDLEKISKGTLKLDLILKVMELITDENIEEFNDLIEHIKKITKKANELKLD